VVISPNVLNYDSNFRQKDEQLPISVTIAWPEFRPVLLQDVHSFPYLKKKQKGEQ